MIAVPCCASSLHLKPSLFFCLTFCKLTQTCGLVQNLIAEDQFDNSDCAVIAVRMDEMTYTEVQEIDSHPLVSPVVCCDFCMPFVHFPLNLFLSLHVLNAPNTSQSSCFQSPVLMCTETVFNLYTTLQSSFVVSTCMEVSKNLYNLTTPTAWHACYCASKEALSCG